MKWPFRVTQPLLDVVEALTAADRKMHGWELAERTGQSSPTVYRVLERLRNAGWVAYEWEQENPEANRPRRRFYWLTDQAEAYVSTLLAERSQSHTKANGLSRSGGDR